MRWADRYCKAFNISCIWCLIYLDVKSRSEVYGTTRAISRKLYQSKPSSQACHCFLFNIVRIDLCCKQWYNHVYVYMWRARVKCLCVWRVCLARVCVCVTRVCDTCVWRVCVARACGTCVWRVCVECVCAWCVCVWRVCGAHVYGTCAYNWYIRIYLQDLQKMQIMLTHLHYQWV